MFEKVDIAKQYDPSERIVVHAGDCLELLKKIPDKAMQRGANKIRAVHRTTSNYYKRMCKNSFR